MSYSRNDFGAAETKPIYLAETAWRACRYATAQQAGGETACALRDALDQLLAYLADPMMRARHERPESLTTFSDWRELAELKEELQVFEMDEGERVRWLERQLVDLLALYSRTLVPSRNFRGGVVYAVRIDDDLELRSRGSGGFECPSGIAPDRLIAKVRIPPDIESWIDLWREPEAEWRRRIDRKEEVLVRVKRSSS